ncbi:MAG: hypothetical protein ACO38G_04940 [Burkholderiaceae bacterium]
MPLPLIELQRIDGTPDTLTAYSGKSLLVVMGFPCNQFGGQEPGSAEKIETDLAAVL